MTAIEDEYDLKGPDANASGIFTDGGFLVKTGSLARKEIVPSGKKVTSIHQRLIADGILEEHGEQLRFTQDYVFKSPSGAALRCWEGPQMDGSSGRRLAVKP